MCCFIEFLEKLREINNLKSKKEKKRKIENLITKCYPMTGMEMKDV